MGDSTFVEHEACPSCGSRDNLARYSDGHAVCFSHECDYYEHSKGSAGSARRKTVSGLVEGEAQQLVSRGISEETCRTFKYLCGEYKGRQAQLATYCDATGTPVAQKVRMADKKFTWVGEPKLAALFGQHLWSNTRKMVVITEGEIDALSVSQVQDNKWPVVSVPNGAKGAAAAIAAQLEWLDPFEKVVFMFDMDEPGRAAAKECAELLTPGKAFIAELSRNDPNDMLVAHEEKKLINAIWNARVYRPDGIVAGVDMWELLAEAQPIPSIRYPWLGLTDMTRGLRKGELVTFCAGTGVGKSTCCREIAYHLMNEGEVVGYVALEENVRRTALGLMSLHADTPLHLTREGVSDEAYRAAYDATVGSGRLFLYDHWGSLASDNLFAKVKQMVRGCGVQWVILDHVSIVVSGIDTDNERKVLDVVMTRLRSLAEELGIGILIVSHLSKGKQGKNFEGGAAIDLGDLRGSYSIAQLSDIVVALERDQQDESNKDIAKMRVLKNRFTGDTGVAGHVRYEKKTGRLRDCDDPFENEVTDEKADF